MSGPLPHPDYTPRAEVPTFFSRFGFPQVWLVGSHLYGLNTPDSDVDFGGVYFRKSLVVDPFYEEVETRTAENNDYYVHSLSKFARLLVKGNPNLVDLVFTPPIRVGDTVARFIEAVKPYVIHEGLIRAYLGYAQNEYNRGFLHAKRQNPQRRALIEELGYDPKYVSHLFRLMVAVTYTLEWKDYYNLRADEEVRQYLLNVKLGKYTKEQLLDAREKFKEAMEYAIGRWAGTAPTADELEARAREFFLSEFNL